MSSNPSNAAGHARLRRMSEGGPHAPSLLRCSAVVLQYRPMGEDDARADNPLPHLDTFSAAAELSSFTAAAKAMGLTQSAISQRIQVLEKCLGLALFRRRGGRVVLTDAGRRLYPYAQRILALHREALEEMTGQTIPVAGELVLWASSVPGEHLLPAVLSEFHGRYPHVRLRTIISDSMGVIHQIVHGQVSVGLVGTRTNSPDLEFRHFATDRMVLVVPPTHTWAGRKRVSLKQLRTQQLILRECGSGQRSFFERLLERAGTSVTDLHVVSELGSNESIKEAVVRGVGVAVLSVRAVQGGINTGQLRGLNITGLDSERELFVVWDRRRILPAPARSFIHFLESCAPASVPVAHKAR